ncbi:membrane integrity-associated transporter subunit PqiC [Celerinatantimonas sp. YJH-8]|uniref:PqiC family protein n=1 Tax=Celerinatantimonas sp. YJH-8 TaxID=3228714 RepID=UPI0038C133CF
MMKPWLWISVISLLWLSGCSQNPSPLPRQYLLTDVEAVSALPESSTSAVERPVQITVLPIQLPGYLTSDSMVLISPQGEVFSSQNNLWAEPLAIQLQRLLKARLQQRLPTVNWYIDNNVSQYKLLVQLSQFAADTEGWVHISGIWQLRDPNGKLIRQQLFTLKQAMVQNGYLAMSQALTKAWLTAVDQMAQKMDL